MVIEDHPGGNPAVRASGMGAGCIVSAVIFCGLLVAGYLGGRSRMSENGMKSEAMHAAAALTNAVSQFETDYNRLPLAAGVPGGGDWDCNTSGAVMISVLKGVNVAENPQETDYLGEIKEAKILAGPRYVDGIYRENDRIVALYDPWGHPYWMRLDGNKDGQVEDPSQPGVFVRKKVIVWSAGRDGNFATWDDNIATWNR